jgi:recombination protein RecA
MRSGAFGLIVLDLGDGIEAARGLSPALQARLQGLAQRNGGLLICLTSKAPSSSSLGPGVSLHAESRRKREQGHFSCSLRAVKDRRRPPGWIHREVVRGTPGLR